MLPTLRRRLKTVSFRNKSLQDILFLSRKAYEIVSVDTHHGGIHNTKLVVKIDLGKDFELRERFVDRVQFYNRLDLKDIMKNIDLESNSLLDIINELNLKGFDFTTEDLDITDGYLTAKPASLGYIGFFPSKIQDTVSILPPVNLTATIVP